MPIAVLKGYRITQTAYQQVPEEEPILLLTGILSIAYAPFLGSFLCRFGTQGPKKQELGAEIASRHHASLKYDVTSNLGRACG